MHGEYFSDDQLTQLRAAVDGLIANTINRSDHMRPGTQPLGYVGIKGPAPDSPWQTLLRNDESLPLYRTSSPQQSWTSESIVAALGRLCRDVDAVLDVIDNFDTAGRVWCILRCYLEGDMGPPNPKWAPNRFAVERPDFPFGPTANYPSMRCSTMSPLSIDVWCHVAGWLDASLVFRLPLMCRFLGDHRDQVLWAAMYRRCFGVSKKPIEQGAYRAAFHEQMRKLKLPDSLRWRKTGLRHARTMPLLRDFWPREGPLVENRPGELQFFHAKLCMTSNTAPLRLRSPSRVMPAVWAVEANRVPLVEARYGVKEVRLLVVVKHRSGEDIGTFLPALHPQDVTRFSAVLRPSKTDEEMRHQGERKAAMKNWDVIYEWD